MSDFASIMLSVAITLLASSITYVGIAASKYARQHSAAQKKDVPACAPPLGLIPDAVRTQVTAVWLAAFNHAVTQHEKLTSFMRVVALAAIVMWTALVTQKLIALDPLSISSLGAFLLCVVLLVGPHEALAYGPRDIANDVARKFNTKSPDIELLPEQVIKKTYFWPQLVGWTLLLSGFILLVIAISPRK